MLRALWQDLTRVGEARQPWPLAVAAALAVGLPLLMGVWHEHMAAGSLAAMGALAIMHWPLTHTAPSRSQSHSAPMRAAAQRLFGCGAAISASILLGQLTNTWPASALLLFGLVMAAIVAGTAITQLPPPGHTLFVLAASSAAATGQVPSMWIAVTALPLLGALWAWIIGCLALAVAARLCGRPPQHSVEPWAIGYSPGAAPIPALTLLRTPGQIATEALVFGGFAMAALGLAQYLGLERPYWAPISCVAVMRAMSLRAVWTRHLQRVLGTAAGVCVTLGILVAHPRESTAVVVTMLITMALYRTMGQNYAVTVLLATPAGLVLTELAHLGSAPDTQLLLVRLQDIALGCTVGLVGGAVLRGTPAGQRI